jgi:hypothetical protein
MTAWHLLEVRGLTVELPTPSGWVSASEAPRGDGLYSEVVYVYGRGTLPPLCPKMTLSE